MNIFNDIQREKAQQILANPLAKLASLSSGEIRDLCCVWCYYSGKIEGNTYTYVETESLLKDGITSEKRYEDAKMLKNLYNVFSSELEYIRPCKLLRNSRLHPIRRLLPQPPTLPPRRYRISAAILFENQIIVVYLQKTKLYGNRYQLLPIWSWRRTH